MIREEYKLICYELLRHGDYIYEALLSCKGIDSDTSHVVSNVIRRAGENLVNVHKIAPSVDMDIMQRALVDRMRTLAYLHVKSEFSDFRKWDAARRYDDLIRARDNPPYPFASQEIQEMDNELEELRGYFGGVPEKARTYWKEPKTKEKINTVAGRYLQKDSQKEWLYFLTYELPSRSLHTNANDMQVFSEAEVNRKFGTSLLTYLMLLAIPVDLILEASERPDPIIEIGERLCGIQNILLTDHQEERSKLFAQ
ncbi:MAG: DUF5677 domain-containing protein [Chloroflexota bacterium]|nr:DUF5677 domain-containing protein [Chloroflexota bacterium]